ncbi:uncharacterized protein LOC118183530 isoform X2 [Stegodyphus dumicola]|uniref:uncharacterized protein LOC118183530 isoform X2 n=1 Tax=Stegodyphus dumicola TaxID=202533 RepID=UPI0015ACEEF9|nr:uncharacterized protein LOC118183530 isoform X2 [Stegodyphus dumicola]
MKWDLVVPAGYKPLPPIVSETSDKFRWPFQQARAKCILLPDRIPVGGSQESPPRKPRLKYHKQSSYTDTFVKFPQVFSRVQKPDSGWLDPVGKYGDFKGDSSYEEDFQWPRMQERTKVFPLVSTVGMGILPLLGEASKKAITLATILKEKREIGDHDTTQDTRASSYWERHCNPGMPTECVETTLTTHLNDYTMHSRDRKTDTIKKLKSTLKFSGDMETTSTTMRDYMHPKPHTETSRK